MKPQLFLLKMPFMDDAVPGPVEGPWFCSHCALLEGALLINPHWAQHIDIIRVDFQKPRQPLIDVLGAEDQWLPSLVVDGATRLKDPVKIAEFLATKFGGAHPHP